jgi:ABC-2 type transport system permease protein
MTALSYAATDSATMLRRNLRRALRYPALTLATLMTPIVILLLFVGVLGGTLGSGLASATRGEGYVDYVAPGIVLMTVASGCLATSVAVCVDVAGGIVDRFRTMAIARASLLTGHVLGSMIQTLVSTVLVIGVALLLGFSPSASFGDWLALAGLLVLVTFSLTWLAVWLGLVSKTPESASNKPLLVQFLPFLSSAFVPTDSMPAGLRWFAENQPFTPIVETARGLLLGTPIGDSAALAVAWCTGIAVVSHVASRVVFDRPRAS